jgi:hypothetical protein
MNLNRHGLFDLSHHTDEQKNEAETKQSAQPMLARV